MRNQLRRSAVLVPALALFAGVARAVDFDRADLMAQFRVLKAESRIAIPAQAAGKPAAAQKNVSTEDEFEFSPKNSLRLEDMLTAIRAGKTVAKKDLEWGNAFVKKFKEAMTDPKALAEGRAEIKKVIMAENAKRPKDKQYTEAKINEMLDYFVKIRLLKIESQVEEALRILNTTVL